MSLKSYPKIYWILGIGILAGLFMSAGDIINFLMNLLQGNLSSSFLYEAFNGFSFGFFYILTPLIVPFFLFRKKTTSIIRTGLIGAVIFPILVIIPRMFFIDIFPQLGNFFASIFGQNFNGFLGTYIYIVCYAFVGFIIGIFLGWFYRKIFPRKD